MLKRFLGGRTSGRAEGISAKVFLGAFGKHPGWDDHIDDIGLETEVLVAVKRTLYTEGISTLVDSGDWQQLDEAQRTRGFDHVFIRVSGGDCVAGQMWSSRDGKGRTLYPMVVAAHCRGLSLEWALTNLLPELAQIKDGCTSTTSAREVVAIVDFHRGELLHKAEQAPAERREAALPSGIAELARCGEMGPRGEGLVRVLYQIEREMPGLAAHTGRTALTGVSDRSHHIRVPACGDSIPQSALRWIGFMTSQLGDKQDVTLIFPLRERWVDIIIGEPSARQLFCVQASPQRIPLSTEIPYSIDGEFRARVAALIEKAAGEAGPPAAGPAADAAAESPAAPREAEGAPASGALAAASAGLTDAKEWLKRHWVVVLGVLLLALILAGLMFALSQRSPREIPTAPQPHPEAAGFSPSDWQRLCEDYYNWLGGLLTDLKDEQRRAAWGRDSQLSKVLSALDDPRAVLSPREIANTPAVDIQDLGKSPPKAAMNSANARKTAEALKIVDEVEKLLAPESWPLLATIKAQVEHYAQNGWHKPAEELKQLVKNAKPEESRSLAAGLDAILREGPAVLKAKETEDGVRALAENMRKPGDPVLEGFYGFVVADLAGAEELAALQSGLEGHLKLAERIDEFMRTGWPLVDRELFNKESKVQALSKGGLSATAFEDWLTEARRYRKMEPDPRGRREDWQARIDETARLLATLPADGAARLRDSLAEVRRGVDEMWQVAGIEKNDEDLRARTRDLEKRIRGIREEIASLTANKDEWYSFVRAADKISDSPAANAAWVAYRDRLLPSPAPETLTAEQFLNLRPKVDGLKVELRRLEGLVPAAGVDLPGSSFQKTLLAEALKSRERHLQRVLKSTRWTGEALESDPSVEAQAKSEHDAWVASFSSLLGYVGKMESRLDACYMVDERETPEDGETLGSLFERCRKADVYVKEDGIRAALAGPMGRVEKLLAIEEVADHAGIAAMAKEAPGKEKEALVGIWRKAGSIEDWPRDVGELRAEGNLRQAVLDVLTGIGTRQPERATALRAHLRLDGEGPRRWSNCFGRLSDRGDIEQAAQLRDKFGVSDAELEPRLRFNLALASFRRQCATLRDTDELKGTLESFVQSVESLGQGVGQSGKVRELIGGLEGIRSKPDAAGHLGKAGPGAADWTVDASASGDAIEYRSPWSGSATPTLKFLRVHPGASPPQMSYVSATEVSAGFFIETIRSLGTEGEFSNLLPNYGDVDSRSGPRTWERERGGRITISQEWLFPLRPNWTPYPAGFEPPEPSLQHPMQYVPPEAAMYFCALLGCRLPSPSEWKAALDANPSYGPEEAPNLRDVFWKRQYGYGTSAGEDSWMPDKDVFWPGGARARRDGARRDESVATGDDGALWFGEVQGGGGKGFHHLVGNVAEFVYEPPKAPEQIGKYSAPAFHELLLKNPEAIRVIGGSALSSPELWNGRDKPYDTTYPVDLSASRGEFAKTGYSDVGFRMAFTVPGYPLKDSLTRLLDQKNWYLTTLGE